MLIPNSARSWIGGLTWLLVAYVVGFVALVCFVMIGASKEFMDSFFPFLMGAHFLAMMLGMALLVAYIIDVVNNPNVPSEKRVLWMLVVFLGGFIGMLVYWYCYMRHPVANSD